VDLLLLERLGHRMMRAFEEEEFDVDGNDDVEWGQGGSKFGFPPSVQTVFYAPQGKFW
jgi:hypothetical protein